MSARDVHRDATPTSTSTPDGTTSTHLNTLRTSNSSPWLRTARHLTGYPVLRRRLAQHRLEVFDEVRLVEVTQLRRQLCPRCSGVPLDAFRRLLQAEALNHPLRCHAHVTVKKPLQRPHGHTRPLGQLFHLDDRSVFHR